MQLRVTYWPIGYVSEKDKYDLVDEIIYNQGWYYYSINQEKIEDCIDETNDGRSTVISPFITWEVISCSGESNDAYTCGLDFEWKEGDSSIFFEGYERYIWEMSKESFENHPKLQRYFDGIHRLPIGKRFTLSDIDYLLDICFVTAWNYWSSYDDYTGEMDVEVTMEGKINLEKFVKECLEK
jgi:hypothetical protein